MNRITHPLLILAFAMSAFGETQKDFTVHEWGTFTSVQGGNGELLPWRPLQTSDLPGFVYDWTKPGLNRYSSGIFVGKGQMVTLQRMETPVIYFYSDKVMNADVSVSFPKGLITEWYPQATQIGPSLPGTNAISGALPDSRVIWKNLLLTPVNQLLKYRNVARQDRSGSHYYSAQRTSANTVQVIPPGQTNDIETDRFVFYRGAGSFKTPLHVTVDTNSIVTVENSGVEALAHLFLVAVHDGKGSFGHTETLAPNKSRTWFALNPNPYDSQTGGWFPLEEFQNIIGAQMEKALTSEGLFPLEAKAMVDTWKDSWFIEDGVRVLYVLPRAWTDETLPMTLNPQPESLVRVMAGRAEIITPGMVEILRESLVAALAHDSDPVARGQAVAEMKKRGRFAEPALRLVNRPTGINAPGTLGYDYLSEAAKPGVDQLEQLYLAWQRECETISTSSITGDYIGLPSYRKMVAVGKPALPFLEEKMKSQRGLDFMLAFAVVEILGWNKSDFIGGGEQSFRDRVLKKLQETAAAALPK